MGAGGTRRVAWAAATGAILVLCGAADAPPPGSYAAGPPPGHTGGFGEPTCQACHTEFPLNEPPGSLRVEGLPERYEPGRTYTLTLRLRDRDMGAAGVQASIRWAAGEDAGRSAGGLEALDGRLSVETGPDGVAYVQQTQEGSVPESPELASWSFLWTAPRRPGRVAVHAAANSANGDNSPFGDLVFTSGAVTARGVK